MTNRVKHIGLIGKHTFVSVFKEPATMWLVGLFIALTALSLCSTFWEHHSHHHTVEHYSHDVRERWENNPDKHPHRMAHYGYVVFRDHYPLSFFDTGMDSYLGNAVFLEAHRQNSINFSQASMSTGMLRFGEISAGMILTLLLPLLMFFWSFSLIAGERESGILRLSLSQGATWTDLILGKSLGVFFVSLLIFIPTMFLSFLLLVFYPAEFSVGDMVLRFGSIIWCYLVYLFVVALIGVTISAWSSTQKSALVKLIGIWLFFTLIFPKIGQVAGQLIYPTPSRIAFDSAVHEDIVQQGDSHDPDDPHFNALKDSVLAEYGVTSTQDLPFNYGGFVMSQGEELSTMTYREHKEELMGLYDQQSRWVKYTAFINPYIAMKNISLAFSDTDFLSYRHFDTQAEAYRYDLAQRMNELQMEHISNKVSTSADKGAVISNQFWKDHPDFEPSFLTFWAKAESVIYALASLLLWLVGLLLVMRYRSHRLSAV